MLKLDRVFCLLLVNFILRFSCGDQTVLLKGENEGEAGNHIGVNKPLKKGDVRKEVTPDSELKIGPQIPENIKITKNKYDKESEARENPVPIGKKDIERLAPAVKGDKLRFSKQPDVFFQQKPAPLTCQPQMIETKEEKDFKKALKEEKKNEQKSDVSKKEVSAQTQLLQCYREDNYASEERGASIVGHNPEADNVNGILSSNKDRYLQNPCAATEKWFVVKLFAVIHVKEIRTGSFELFSSLPQNISVYVSDRYPTKNYNSLGVFQLTENRKLHRFQIKKGDYLPVNYIKVEMLTHCGKEQTCALFSFEVYGIPFGSNTKCQKFKNWNNTEAPENEKEAESIQTKTFLSSVKDYFAKHLKDSSNIDANISTDANDAGSSETINPDSEKTNVGFIFVVLGIIIGLVIMLFAYYASKRKFYDKRNTDGSVEKSSQMPDSTSRKRCYNREPITNDSESTSQSANHVCKTTLLYDRKHDGNIVPNERENDGDFNHTPDIVEDTVPDISNVSNSWPTGTSTLQSREKYVTNDQSQKRASVETLPQRLESVQSETDSNSGNICSSHDLASNVTESEINSHSANHEEKYDILLLYSDKDKSMACKLLEQLTSNSVSKSRFLKVVLIEEFAPDVQSKVLTMEYVFERCKYLFVLVTTNLKNDRLKRFQGGLALIDSIEKGHDGVIPIWAQEGAENMLFELSLYKGIHFKQNLINFQVIERLFRSQ